MRRKTIALLICLFAILSSITILVYGAEISSSIMEDENSSSFTDEQDSNSITDDNQDSSSITDDNQDSSSITDDETNNIEDLDESASNDIISMVEIPLIDRLHLQYGIDEFEPNLYQVLLTEDKGSKYKVITKPLFQFTNSNFYDPIIMISDTTVLLGYHSIYKDGDNEATPLNLPFDYIFHAAVSPDKTKIAYYAKLNDEVVIACYNMENEKIQTIKTLDPDDYNMLYEISLFLDWGDDFNLFFDSPKMNYPTIENYDFTTGSIVEIASSAKCPSVSDDNTVMSWIEHDVYVGKSLKTPMTIIKSGKLSNKFDGYSAVKYSNTNNIYRIDYINSRIDKLDYSTLKTMSSLSIDGEILGASIKDGVLNYYSIPRETIATDTILSAPEEIR